MKLICVITAVFLGHVASSRISYPIKRSDKHTNFADFFQLNQHRGRVASPQNNDVFERELRSEDSNEFTTERIKPTRKVHQPLHPNLEAYLYNDNEIRGEDNKATTKRIYRYAALKLDLPKQKGHFSNTYHVPEPDLTEAKEQKALEDAGGIYFDDPDGRLLLDLGLFQDCPQ